MACSVIFILLLVEILLTLQANFIKLYVMFALSYFFLFVVTEDELKRLYRRFKKLDTDGSGTLTTDEFLSVPELAGNPLLEPVISIFDKNKNNEIEFKEFISALSTFSEKGNKDGKLRCIISFIFTKCVLFLSLKICVLFFDILNLFLVAFQVYDMDGDGYISNGELFHVFFLSLFYHYILMRFFFNHN